MKILLLEDDQHKREEIVLAIRDVVPHSEIIEATNWLDYVLHVNRTKFDLILLDLLVPRSQKDPKIEDHCIQLIEATRGFESKSFRTPAIVLTRYLKESEEFLQELNSVDINVISFADDGRWRAALAMKVSAAIPSPSFEFVILCALPKEATAYDGLVTEFGSLKTISGLQCREITIARSRGVIVLLPRMGLVASGVISSLAIERFKPKLICMSGICGGIPKSAQIYDILVSEVCHQHDVGKWSNEGFKSEHYDIQIKADVRNKLESLCDSAEFLKSLAVGLDIKKSEYPKGMESLRPKIKMAATSSGSAVLAEQGKTASLAADQRKLAGFDMEVFAIYEAARLSASDPAVFAVKAVVDDGDKNKGDSFHRIGCLLSAKFAVAAIEALMAPA